jgi:eukaryotic-like serine/threonine-protein kinase
LFPANVAAIDRSRLELPRGTSCMDAIRSALRDFTCRRAVPPMIPTQDQFPGTTRFQILARLGVGGMGVVYRARDRDQNREVALKTLQRFDPRDLYRLKHEFRSLADVLHPNLVHLYELVSDGERWFFTMELVDGVSFCDWVWRRDKDGGITTSRVDDPAVRDVTVSIITSAAPGSSAPVTCIPPPSCDFERLRDALCQLALGVNALHAAGRLHRDIKPSNVMVTRSGRVVLLDFGLVSDPGLIRPRDSIGDGLSGTPAYMSPEQAADEDVTPASDWYSVGVMMYEVLSGRLPFEGTVRQVLNEKSRVDPVSVSLRTNAPADLAELCMALLRRRPRDRPDGADLLRRLGANSATRVPEVTGSQESVFVGRLAELETLAGAFAAVREGRTMTVHVHGPSGIGKTALVDHFGRGCSRSGSTVLAGRCYERESVPYKALDSLIDALSRHLRRLGRDAAALLPRDVRPLVRLFPVLKQAEAVASAPLPAIEMPDPQEVRRKAFAAVKELFARMADRSPLVLWIDDLQWGDADSAALLTELVRPPDAPALLLILSYRSEDRETSVCVRALRAAAHGENGLDLRVDPLLVHDASQLAAALLPAAAAARVAHVALEGEGNPLFVVELARDVGSESSSLDQLLLARVAQLGADARRLLEVTSVAGAPIGISPALQAAEAEQGGLVALAVLRAARLVRAAGTEGHIEPYHDRIRETVMKHMDASRARACHAALARALEDAGGADPEALAFHLQAAGARARAADFAARAARAAGEALAFDRAARLYRLALELDTDGDLAGAPPRHESERLLLKVELAKSLANAGRGSEAGDTFLAAAEAAPPSQALELRWRAAAQYLRCGRVPEGLSTLRIVLKALGIPMAATPRGALARLLLRRAGIRLRGLSYQERNAAEVPPDLLLRVDVCRSVALGLSMIDVIHSRDFQTRHFALALRAGEPSRVAVAFALEGAGVAAAGDSRAARKGDRLLRLAAEIARRIDEPYAVAGVDVCGGVTDYCLGRWRRARDQCTRGAAILRERCTDVAFELDTAGLVGLWARFYLGELGALGRELDLLLEDAEARGDLFATTGLRASFANTGWLAADQIDRARREVELARKQWSYEGFQTQHRWLLMGEGFVDLYAGEGGRAWERLEAAWPAFRRSLQPRIGVARAQMAHLRGVSALTAACEAPDDSGTAALFDVADSSAVVLMRHPIESFQPMGVLLRAGTTAARGDRDLSAALLDEAAHRFDAAEMRLYAAVARHRWGKLTGGDAGRTRMRQVEEWMAAQGIQRPDRISQMLAPGFGRD